MTGETVKFEKPVEGGDDAKREQSTITFPYLDLDSAVEVARAVYNRGGHGSCNVDELAAEMNQTVSGAFRLKTGTAKIFDLIDKDGKSGFKLSELGRQIISPDTERAARAESFMRVPLYGAVYEKYRGHMLPPPKALEREMLSLGVSSKQTDKARQAFERSAKQAGYFESGEDRLVRPRADSLPRKDDAAADSIVDTKKIDLPGGGGAGGGGNSGGGAGGGTPPTQKALEYQLIDLMAEPDIDDAVKQAIWSLVQYLTARKAKNKSPSIFE
ncbi:hypothetical protein [Bradyrhizobium sp. AZCC 2289]|uniref:hypothetical protein n=1 Tax=Bradyrhizobium sp. AZCC 2289 TaxID=3117026 RepID=UPI002FEF1653